MPPTVAALAKKRVRDYMTPDPTTLDDQAPLLEAVLTIRRLNVRHLPVVNNGKLVGLLTDRDITRFAPSVVSTSQEEYNRVFEETLVAKAMTKNVTTVTPDSPLAEAVALLQTHKWGCLPVVENGKVVGIFTVTDALRFAHDVLSGTPA